ncbi:putative disease resistance RPP13-like protein 1 [Morus notabilis]|uniref:putative disease resistance RPP13-like protein 1 n=1 Tax=Morus notabilis TaxID=981085 RepID=UPI000CED74C9|nr:putative disease resistance RPP13-like protein 1 [Morus notabilis]
MAQFVGSALLSGFFNVLFDRMATQEVLNFFRGKKVLAKLLDELKIRLLSANKLMNDAEVKQLTDENVKKWLDDLKQVLYEADHAMDEINTEALRRKVEAGDQSGSRASKFINSISTFFGAFENTVRSEIEDILSRLKSLSDQALFLGLKEGDQKRLLRRLPAPWAEESDVYGREKDKEKIIELLLSNDAGGPNLSVIAIVGMGGIGKTTLAQLLYNDTRVREHFDLTEWTVI